MRGFLTTPGIQKGIKGFDMTHTSYSCVPVRKLLSRWVFFPLLFLSSLFVATNCLADGPGLLWTTNVGGRLFSVDGQTNLYANAGGSVITLSDAGPSLQTNTICPLPGIARRDLAGNYFFGGIFDGTQDFGGITLVGGCTICYAGRPGQWLPGYPTCFLAKYNGSGSLLWVKSFGQMGATNNVSDLLVDANGKPYAGYSFRSGGLAQSGHVARYDDSGAFQWDQPLPNTFDPILAVKLGGLTVSNCSFFTLRIDSFWVAGQIDTAGNAAEVEPSRIRWRSDAASNFRARY
jgi:hypothetical protein